MRVVFSERSASNVHSSMIYCYHISDLTDDEVKTIHKSSCYDIALTCPHVEFIVHMLFYCKQLASIYVYKYDRVKNEFLKEMLVNEEAFSTEWMVLGTDEEPYIKCALSQVEWDEEDESGWGYFDVKNWRWFEM